MSKQYQFTSSPASREPLLTSAQSPGMMSNRNSESSLASYDQHNPRGPGSNTYSGFSSATNPRFGPTANVSPPSSTLHSPGLGTSKDSLVVGKNGYSGPLSNGMEEDDDLDDHLHTFTAAEKRDLSSKFDITSWRGWANGLTLAFLALAVLMLFAGYPILSYYHDNNKSAGSATAGYNLGGINASGQYPSISGLPSLIDADTPSSVYTRTGFDGNEWTLTFSDEFNKEGRTFYDGDDPFFQAVDIHYWPTGDFEWYDPSAVTTKNGHLVITMTQEPIHDLNFKSGMLQSWNKLCFNKNAYFEVSASLPGVNDVGGFWPGVWTMGNLGRPGYGASTEGTWPYSYDSCDIGTLKNQTTADGTGPDATLTTGSNGGPLSYLPGQRLSSCTCAGEDHPGPHVGVGRSAPEIDMIEAQIVIDKQRGQVSQSYQLAPFDDYYQFNNASANYEQYDTDLSYFNTYLGGSYQQAASTLTYVDSDIYFNTSANFAVFGFEYASDSSNRENAYITWVASGKKSWTLRGTGLQPNTKTEIGQRMITEEPMALIFNLAASNNFQNVDFENMIFPNELRIDYIRVYQLSTGSIGCDPADHPTADYIAKFPDAYSNPNFTTWSAAGYTWPKNSLIDTC
ncbi:beta-glucan synthesis-associated protein KRE6, partial [Tremellales sp. Uapishka_1]